MNGQGPSAERLKLNSQSRAAAAPKVCGQINTFYFYGELSVGNRALLLLLPRLIIPTETIFIVQQHLTFRQTVLNKVRVLVDVLARSQEMAWYNSNR